MPNNWGPDRGASAHHIPPLSTKGGIMYDAALPLQNTRI